MPVLQIEEGSDDENGGGKYPLLPEGTEVNVKVVGVKEQDSFFLKDPDKPELGKQRELSFKFKIVDPEFAGMDGVLWGNTPVSPKVGNKLYFWLCALFNTDSLEVGIAVDTADLVDTVAVASIRRYVTKKGVEGQNVGSLFAQSAPPREVVPEVGSQTQATPFTPPKREFVEEPF